MSTLIFAVSLTLFVALARAQSSLYIPGLDPQPISAGVLGVGNDGRTTWEIQQGTLSGTFTDPGNFGFYPVPVTMVEGPNDAVYSVAITDSADPFALAVSCTINNGVAVCVDTVSEGSNGVSTATGTETVTPIAIQGGGPISGAGASAPATTSAPANGTPTQSSGGSQASAGSSPASSGAQATGTPGGKNGAVSHEIAGSLLLLGVIGNVIWYIL